MHTERVAPPRWLWVEVLASVALTCALCGVQFAATEQPTAARGRVAIRVQCDDAAACVLAESLAEDVWSEQRGARDPLDVVVTRDDLGRLAAADVPFEVLVPDIDAVARTEYMRLRDPRAAQPADWFAEYRDYRAITSRIHELAAIAPDRASVLPLGSTLEGRTLWALRIGGRSPDATPMLITGTQHAREWIAAMVTTCVADRLVRDYDRDPAIRSFVDSTELWIVPVVNPDGYQYSWATDRYWRKNRRGGHGVDLNRNYSVAWGGSGSSGNKGSQVYRGENAFSEVESSALRDLAKREQIAFHIDFHSYGQLVMYPWLYTATPAKDRDRYAALGDRIASAMFAQHQTRYRLISGVESSPTAGTLTDWMYGEGGALSYTIELRPRGGGGFVLPPEEIRPTCDEGLAAVLALRGAR
ncbi:MAG TPA: M14 family zinc carboxypeptidase [Kofleriaceae bacterium]